MSKDFIGFRVTPDVKKQLEAEAEKEMRPLSHLIRDRVLRPAEDAPVPYESEHDKANKAKIRKAVENEEPYEVKIEPGTSVPSTTDSGENERQNWIRKRELQLQGRMSTRAAQLQARQDWDRRND